MRMRACSVLGSALPSRSSSSSTSCGGDGVEFVFWLLKVVQGFACMWRRRSARSGAAGAACVSSAAHLHLLLDRRRAPRAGARGGEHLGDGGQQVACKQGATGVEKGARSNAAAHRSAGLWPNRNQPAALAQRLK